MNLWNCVSIDLHESTSNFEHIFGVTKALGSIGVCESALTSTNFAGYDRKTMVFIDWIEFPDEPRRGARGV